MPLSIALVAVACASFAVWRARFANPSELALLEPGTSRELKTRNSSGRAGAYFLPTGYRQRRLPLAVVLHGTGSGGAQMLAEFRALAEREKFIVVAPDSGLSPNGGPATWEVGDHPGEVTEDFEHVERCLEEVLALPGVAVDTTRTLIIGHSGGGSSAPYVASNAEPYTAFAVLHGGVFGGGLGPRRVRGWFSTGDADALRPPQRVKEAAATVQQLGFDDIEYHEFHEGHEMGEEELAALIVWWLRH